MPPPDFIPAHPYTGPQRPMSATELHFPERTVSGPQRVLRHDIAQAKTSTNAVRSGPIRPFSFKPTSSEDGSGAEKKERVVGGARRVPRMPEPEPAPPADDRGKAATGASRPALPIRPRVISTSKSTPAVPLHAAAVVKEEPARVKKLASSVGASSKPATGAPTAKLGRTASTSTVQATASSRARTAEKTQDRAAERDERRVRTQSREEREKEKAQAKDQEKTRERKSSSKTTAAIPTAASRHGPAPTVTMRDKTNRMHAKASAKEATKDAQKVSSKARSSPDVPEVVEVVSPAEVPLPDTPKVSPVPVEEASPPPLICLDTPEKDVLAPTPAPAPVPAPAAPAPVFKPLSPAEVPLPSSRPNSADGTSTPPLSDLAPPVPAIDFTEPHTRTPERQPQRRGAEVEQTPISALVASIQREFLAMNRGSPLETMAEMDEEESILVGDAGEADGAEMFPPVPVVEPLFSRSVHA
ncbi:hypothetical protein C8T65DRAFT_784280 [Cerioporus squamosus]|nr:hypothetical protein C8T65DRAFT_784280 [Cerioporus squamosus]